MRGASCSISLRSFLAGKTATAFMFFSYVHPGSWECASTPLEPLIQRFLFFPCSLCKSQDAKDDPEGSFEQQYPPGPQGPAFLQRDDYGNDPIEQGIGREHMDKGE